MITILELTCPDPQPPSDMIATFTSVSQNSTSVYTCLDGYRFANLSSYHTTTCVYDSISDTMYWTDMTDSCVGETLTLYRCHKHE